MGSVNRVFLMGNLTRDPQIRQTPGGVAVGEICVAVSEKYKSKEGQVVEKTCFADVVVWGSHADSCAKYLQKGSAVMVEGSLQFDQWQTEKGEKRSRLRVRAQRIQFLARTRRDAEPGEGEVREVEAGMEAADPAIPL